MASKIVIRRLSADELPMPPQELKNCTLGVMQVGTHAMQTIEREWIPGDHGCGEPFESCVPPGLYRLVVRKSPSKGVRFHIVNPELGVFLEAADRKHPWQRYACMLHVANYWSNVQGCIGPGASLHYFGGGRGWGVTSSQRSLAALEDYIILHNIAELEII